MSLLSADQLRDVADVLRQPLANRTVLIPLGTKAFVAGKLTPTLTSDTGAEQVYLRDELMTREKAIERLEVERKQLLLRKNAAQPVSSAPLVAAPLISTTDESDGSFFEIREEINESGQEIKSEAINVTHQLRELSAATGASAAPSKKSTAPIESTRSTVNSDDDYGKLALRLDELAKLEDQAEQNQQSSSQSRNKLQSSGWSKGFFNNNKKKKQPSINVTKTATPVPAMEPIIIEPDNAPQQQPLLKKVAFDPTNQIQEIPRIGSRSINTERSSPCKGGWSTGFLNTNNKPHETVKRSTIISERVVSSVVVERHSKAKEPPQEAPTETNNEHQPKRLSRFAQQRLDARR
jgi:hypothetical protein